MIKWGQKSKPKKTLGLPTKPNKIPEPKINHPKMPCKVNLTFQSHKSQVKEIKNSLRQKGIPVTIKPGDKHDR